MGLVVGIKQLVRDVVVGVGLIEGAGDGVFRDVQSDELHIRILILGAGDGAGERKAGHHDDVVALVNGLLDHGDTVGGIVAGGLVVRKVNAVFFAECLAGLVGGLVERLVGDVAVVGDHCDSVLGFGSVVRGLGLFLVTAGAQSENHHESEKQSNRSFHAIFLHFKFIRCSDIPLQHGGFHAAYSIPRGFLTGNKKYYRNVNYS